MSSSEIHQIATLAFGDSNKAISSKVESRFGSKGSVCVNLQSGKWFNHESGEGGGLLTLTILAGLASNRQEAIKFIWGDFEGYKMPSATINLLDKNQRLKPPVCADFAGMEKVEQIEVEKRHRLNVLQNIWAVGRNPNGTLVEAYLSNRLVKMPPQSKAVRFFPNARFMGREVLAMGAAISNPISQEFCGIHWTHLTPNGEKGELNKIIAKGSQKRGAVIMLSPFEAVGEVLGIGEGIETTLSLRQLQGLSELPVWALVDSGNLAKFAPLDKVKHLIIAVDNDEAGIKAANKCQENWVAAGKKVTLITPPQLKTDLNDFIINRGQSNEFGSPK